MARINIEKIVEEGQKIVNEMYDLKIHQMRELGNIPDKVDLVLFSILFTPKIILLTSNSIRLRNQIK